MSPFFNMIGLLVSGSVLAGCIGGTTEAEFGKAVAAECAVITEARAGGQEVWGRLVSAAPVEGSYDLTVIGTDAGGSMTTVRQGGTFVANGGDPVALGAVQLDAKQEVAASLVVTLGRGGVLACEE